MECESTLDRVYALRSLASDGASVSIDYESPPEALMCHMLMTQGWYSRLLLQRVEKGLGMEALRPMSRQMTVWWRRSREGGGSMPPPMMTTESLSMLSRIDRLVQLDIDRVN